MKYRELLAIILPLVILQKCECYIIDTGIYEVLCNDDKRENDILLSWNQSTVEWNRTLTENEGECTLDLEVISEHPVRLVFTKIEGWLKLKAGDTVMTLNKDSTYLDFGLQSNFIRLIWTGSANTTIEANFQYLNFQQNECKLEGNESEKNEGKFEFPVDEYNYSPNSVYCWIFRNDAVSKDKFNLTSLEIELDTASINSQNGDALIIGMGNASMALVGPDSLLLTRSITEPLHVYLAAGEAFVTLITGWTYPNESSRFVLNWKRMITGSMYTTEETSTQLPDAWEKAIPLCIITQLSVDEFNKNHSLFKQKVADLAIVYADDWEISYTRISPDTVLIKPEYTVGFGKNDSEGVQILLTIVQQYERNLALFSSNQLANMFSSYSKLTELKMSGFQIVDCIQHQTYWDWFWAACIIFILSIALLLLVWYAHYKGLFNEKREEVESYVNLKSSRQKSEMINRYVTTDRSEIAVSRDKTELRTNSKLTAGDFYPFAEQEIDKNNVQMTTLSKSSLKRHGSAPAKMRKPIKGKTESPRFILKKRRPASFFHRSKPFFTQHFTLPPDTEVKREVEENIYENPVMLQTNESVAVDTPPQAIFLDESLNEETDESKL